MGDDTPTVAAKKADISASNFTRWKQGARADPDFVLKIARAYDADVLEALVAADFLTDEEAGLSSSSGVSARTLRTALQTIQINTAEIEMIRRDMLRELDRLRSLTQESSPAPIADLEHYAADSSPEEPEEGDDGFGEGP